MKISIIYPSDPFGSRVGGINSYIKGLITHSPENMDIEWIGISSHGTERPINKPQKLKIDDKIFTFLPILYEKDQNFRKRIPLSLRFGLALKKLKSHLSKRDILFFHRIEPVIFLTGVNTKKIVLVHNDIIKQIYSNESEVLWSKFPWLYKLFEKIILTNFHHVLSVSSRTVSYYKESFPRYEDKFSFLPTWVDCREFTPSYNKEDCKQLLKNKVLSLYQKKINHLEPWLLFVGRLQQQKNPTLLIESFELFFKTYQKGFLFLLGEGNLKQDIEALIQVKNLSGRVFLLGVQERDTIIRFYHSCDLLLMTSHYEGMPMTVLEALACGLPVVSTDVGEVHRVIHPMQSGQVVEDKAPEAFVQAISKVLDDSDHYNQEACVEAISDYSAEKITNKLFQILKGL